MVCFSDLGWESEEAEEELFPLASLVDPSPSPEEMLEYREVQRALRKAIEGLPPGLRPVVLMHYRDQLSFSEIGRRLKMPESTARSYSYRARRLLRASLFEDGRDTDRGHVSVGSAGWVISLAGMAVRLGTVAVAGGRTQERPWPACRPWASGWGRGLVRCR